MIVDATVHWPRGGSNSDRIVACPGSVNEAAKWPASPSNSYSIDGTHTHTALAFCLNHNLVDCGLILNKELEDHEGKFVVDQARADRVNVALGYVFARLRQNPGAQLFVERFFDTGKRYGIPLWGGSADITLLLPRCLETVDFKDGGRGVSPETFQTVTYNDGAAAELGVGDDVPRRCTIIQPKRSKEPLYVDYSPMEFDVKRQILVKAMRLSTQPDAPRVAGDHCKYCPGAEPGRCPEFTEQRRVATVSVNEAFANVPTVANQNAPLQIPEINGDMSDEQLGKILDAAPIIREVLKEAEAEGLKRALGGRVPPGYKVTRKTSHRKLAENAMEVLEDMRAKKHLKREDYLEEKLKSATQILGSDAVKGLSARMRKRIEEIVIKPEGALQLVPESAPGKPVLVDTASMFANVAKAPKPIAGPAAQPAPVKPSFL